ncbi:hypothetical protein [Priestia koreensis]|uniref:hypothetical protein n=1 Tax=Priestia koreensis TaxID=284581 RepID=UPI0028F729D9|nr:hypothetical protein [Priestia koreensis]
MYLFTSEKTVPSHSSPKSFISTPLGEVHMELYINEKPLSYFAMTESKSFDLHHGGTLYSYVAPAFIAELVLCKPASSLGPHMRIDGICGAVWRVKPLVDQLSVKYSATLRTQKSLEGGENSGEGLDALTWYTNTHMLTIGTEDGTMLTHRGKKNDRMPNCFYTYDELAQHEIVQYINDALLVSIPFLPRNEICQVHFVIAWKKHHGQPEDDVSTWYAVDMVGKDILSAEELA